MKDALNKLKELWKTYGREITLFGGMLVVGVIGFEVGLMEGQATQSKPLVIEVPSKPVPMTQVAGVQSAQASNQKISESTVLVPIQDNTTNQNCKFVGSKNSDKYHLATCAVVKRIKPENKRCFTSEEDAASKGYVAGCLK